jgi:hypothetical protein
VAASVALWRRRLHSTTGTTNQLDSLADRLMYRLSYRNFGDREALVINHSVTSGSGVGVRWYELTNATDKLSARGARAVPTGTFAPTNDFRWMGSAAMDKTGGIAIGYNISSSSRSCRAFVMRIVARRSVGNLGNETTSWSAADSNRNADTLG